MIACLNDGRVQSNFCACTFFENTNKILILNTKKDNFEKLKIMIMLIKRPQIHSVHDL